MRIINVIKHIIQGLLSVIYSRLKVVNQRIRSRKMKDPKIIRSSFVVVIRSGSLLRLLPDESMIIKVNIEEADVVFTYRTNYIDEGFEHPIPRGIWIDARGKSASLRTAITTFTNATLFLNDIISFCANGFAGGCQFHIAYNTTPGIKEREFFEQFIEDERGLPKLSRRIDRETVKEVLKSIADIESSKRIRRAIAQYVLSLRYWRKGDEILAVSHLFMGMEALVPLVRKVEKDRLGLDDNQALADQLGIPIENLDSTIRRKYLFNDDQESHKNAKKVSDGIEHGFLEFDDMRPLAIETRDKTAEYLRKAIIRLIDVPQKTEEKLIKPPNNKPIGRDGYTRYLWGKIESDKDELAPSDQVYPIIDWRFEVENFSKTENQEFKLSFNSELKAQVAEGVGFHPEEVEIFGPEGFIPTSTSIVHEITPKKETDEIDLQELSLEDVIPILREAMQDGQIEELRIRKKDGKLVTFSTKQEKDNNQN